MISAVAVAAAFLDALAPAAFARTPEAAAPVISRQEAVDEAIARNPAITAAREQVEQARARVTEATAFPDPTFIATLTQETSFLKPRTAQTQEYGMGLTLPFPDKFHLRGEAARGDLHSAESSYARMRQQTAAQTVTGLRRPAGGLEASGGSARGDDAGAGLPEEDRCCAFRPGPCRGST